MSRRDPALARQRRLAAYPADFYEILNAARRGAGYSRLFNTHHEAVAFAARFYRFRADAIEEQLPDAYLLRELYISGRDATGALFSARRQGQAPYLLRWEAYNLNSLIAQAEGASAGASPGASPEASANPQAPNPLDEHDQLIADILGRKRRE